MGALHWCMLGATFVLLLCEVAINQLCKSLIILVDGFHTLFLLVRLAFPLSPSPPPQHAPPPHTSAASSSTTNTPAVSSAPPEAPTNGSTVSDTSPSVALGCGLSYTGSRSQSVGVFISTLALASLCISYMIEIINFFMEPEAIRRPLLVVLLGAVSVLYKTLLLWLTWDQLQEKEQARGERSRLNNPVLPQEAELDVGLVHSAVEDSLHHGPLVLSNPGTAPSLQDTDSQTSQTQVNSNAAGVCQTWSHSRDMAETPKDNTCTDHLESQKASQICASSRHIASPEAQRPSCLPSLALVLQGVCSCVLALGSSLLMLLVSPERLHGSGACVLLLYLDPSFSLLAVITLLATAAPQLHRYGLLLLQASPPHICVSDLGRRIASVPGVQAVHDLHVWQLSESFLVASVHVHCHAGFPANRCAELMSGVTKILRSVGVTCCTVQPEFSCCSGGPPAASGGEPSVPPGPGPDPGPCPGPGPGPVCRLACGKACAGNMCCSALEKEDEPTGLLLLSAPAAGETKEEPHTLVIENTFL